MMQFGIVKFGIQRRFKERHKDDKDDDLESISEKKEETETNITKTIPTPTTENNSQHENESFLKSKVMDDDDGSENDDEDVFGIEDDKYSEDSEDAALDLTTSRTCLPTANHVTLEALENTKVAVAQFAATALANSESNDDALKDFAAIQSTLFSLQNQQLFQVQLIQHLQAKLSNNNQDAKIDENGENKMETVQVKNETIKSRTVANETENKKNISESKVASDIKIEKICEPPSQHISSSLAATIITNHDPLPPSDQPNCLEMLQKRTQEVLDSASRDLLTGNLADELLFRKDQSADSRSKGDPFFKHRCRYCGKIFGSDSALQIHIRSHTGERPFKCDMCTSSFTTKGNLKVHYQRHTQRYPPFQLTDHLDRYPSQQIFPLVPFHHIKMDPLPSPVELGKMSDANFTGPSEVIDQNKCADLWKSSEIVKEPPNQILVKSSNEVIQDEPEDLSLLHHPAPNSSTSSSPPSAPSHSRDTALEINDNSWENLIEIAQTSETSKLQHLVDNIENKLTEPNQCVFCQRTLSCRSALQMHLRTHTGERPFRCRLCNRAFATKGNLKAHMIIHKIKPPIRSQFKCPVCHRKFSNSMNLQEHIPCHANEDFEGALKMGDDPWDSADVTMSEMSEDQSYSSQGDYDDARSEDQDGESSVNVEDIQEDNLSRIESEVSEGAIDLSVCVGKRKLGSLESVKEVAVVHGLDWSKRIATTGSKDSKGTVGIVSAAELNFKCRASICKIVDVDDYCVDLADSKEDIGLNYSINSLAHHVALSTNFQINSHAFKCIICDKSFPTKEILSEHLLSHTDPNSNHQPVNHESEQFFDKHSTPEPATLVCKDESNKYTNIIDPSSNRIQDFNHFNRDATVPFKSNQNFNFLKTNNNQALRNCTSSSSSNSEPKNVEIQQQSSLQQPDEPINTKHFCTICRRNFSSSSALQIHMRTHTGDKPFRCTVCQKAFTTKGNLKVHMGTHMWTNGSSRRGRRMSLELPLGRHLTANSQDSSGEFPQHRSDFFYPYFPPFLNGVHNKYNDPNSQSYPSGHHSVGNSNKYARLLEFSPFMSVPNSTISVFTAMHYNNMTAPATAALSDGYKDELDKADKEKLKLSKVSNQSREVVTEEFLNSRQFFNATDTKQIKENG